MSRNTRITGMVAAIGLMLTGLVAAGSPVGAACYPGPNCAGGDAVTDSISAPVKLKVKKANPVTLDGHEEQKDATVHATMRANRKSRVKPKSVDFFVAAGDSYSVVFRVKPMKKGKVTLTGCSTALPEDFDTSNDCLTTVV